MSLAKTANIKQLITFQKVARLGNVSMAAEELFLSQSATSIQLSNLEEAVGGWSGLPRLPGRGFNPWDASRRLAGFVIAEAGNDLLIGGGGADQLTGSHLDPTGWAL